MVCISDNTVKASRSQQVSPMRPPANTSCHWHTTSTAYVAATPIPNSTTPRSIIRTRPWSPLYAYVDDHGDGAGRYSSVLRQAQVTVEVGPQQELALEGTGGVLDGGAGAVAVEADQFHQVDLEDGQAFATAADHQGGG